MDTLDLKISHKIQKLIRKTEKLVEKEIGHGVGVTLLLHPYNDGERPVAEFQYVSTMPRHHMLGAMKTLIAKWESGAPDTPPHMRN